jgi:FkbM family methyltransferase
LDGKIGDNPIAPFEMKFLHLTFHKGCEKEIQYVFTQMGHHVDTWRFDDGETDPNTEEIYRITHERAQKCWNRHRAFFEQYDGIITSDTCPLARPFLQNHWRKPLLIWVCNRFDYLVYDDEFKNLIRDIPNRPLVRIFGYTFIESIYGRYIRGVDWGNDIVVKPIGKNLESQNRKKTYSSSFSITIDKKGVEFGNPKKFYVPLYGNETNLVNLRWILDDLGFANESFKFSHISELLEFQGIVTIPYAWSTFALFERMQLGMVVFVPSEDFLMKLFRENEHPVRKWWFQDPFYLEHPERLAWSEWYCPENREFYVYFDSWFDLGKKMKETDYVAKTEKILKRGQEHEQYVMGQWRGIMDSLQSFLQPPNIIFDIGANIGNWSLANVEKCDRVVAVEASPSTYQLLLESCGNHPKIQCVNAAVCHSQEKEITFYQCRNYNTLSTLNRDWFDDPQSRFYQLEYDAITCPTVSIDQLITRYGKPSFIKIDVEAAEYICLQSLTQAVDLLCFEWASETDAITQQCLDYASKVLGYQRFYLQFCDDPYDSRPPSDAFYSLEVLREKLAQTVPRQDWGMIWVKGT